MGSRTLVGLAEGLDKYYLVVIFLFLFKINDFVSLFSKINIFILL